MADVNRGCSVAGIFLFSANAAIVQFFERYKLPGWMFNELFDWKRDKIQEFLPKIKEWDESDLQLQVMKGRRKAIPDADMFESTHWTRPFNVLPVEFIRTMDK